MEILKLVGVVNAGKFLEGYNNGGADYVDLCDRATNPYDPFDGEDGFNLAHGWEAGYAAARFAFTLRRTTFNPATPTPTPATSTD